MAAMGADRKDLRSRTHQHDFIVADMAEQGLASEFGQGFPGQIGPAGGAC